MLKHMRNKVREFLNKKPVTYVTSAFPCGNPGGTSNASLPHLICCYLPRYSASLHGSAGILPAPGQTAWNFLKNIFTFMYNYGKLYFRGSGLFSSGLHADPVLQ
jgi:hypothetical protein